MPLKTPFTSHYNLRLPVVMAPMFLVSNEAMMQSAMRSGIMGVFPTLNYRREGELEQVVKALNAFKDREQCRGSYGVNIIVQKTNPMAAAHLKICADNKVPFYITSLGNPAEVIAAAHSYGAQVYCDVTNLQHAEKCAREGCDGFIAVGLGAGGHAGPYSNFLLVPALRKAFPNIPVIAAGGVATGEGILSMLALGAAGVSVGTRFIASTEAGVSDAYKQSIVDSGMDDIVMTERLSGTPCSIINTPYAKKLGTKQNFFERILSHNSTTKKYFKMLVQWRGMKKLEAAVKPGNYSNLWCAGQSSELVHDIVPCTTIIDRFESELQESKAVLDNMMGG